MRRSLASSPIFRYNTVVRPRWQEWVIAGAIVALFGAGVAAIWGKDIKKLIHPADDNPAPAPNGAPASSAAAPRIAPPAGPAQGPF
jgi:hypothetical protein